MSDNIIKNDIELAQLNNEVHIWIAKPNSIQTPELLSAYQQLLTPEETIKQQRFRFEHDRHDALITRALVRTVLSHYITDINPRDWQFSQNEKGKPSITNALPSPIEFNISHTNGLIVCAITAQHAVGIDVENITRTNEVIDIADRYFSTTEVNELHSLSTHEEKHHRFFDYWTLKESYIKAWGLGLSIPLGSFSFHINPATDTTINNNISLSFNEDREDNPTHWHSTLLYPNDTYRMAVSVWHKGLLSACKPLRFFHTIPLINYNESSIVFTP